MQRSHLLRNPCHPPSDCRAPLASQPRTLRLLFTPRAYKVTSRVPDPRSDRSWIDGRAPLLWREILPRNHSNSRLSLSVYCLASRLGLRVTLCSYPAPRSTFAEAPHRPRNRRPVSSSGLSVHGLTFAGGGLWASPLSRAEPRFWLVYQRHAA